MFDPWRKKKKSHQMWRQAETVFGRKGHIWFVSLHNESMNILLHGQFFCHPSSLSFFKKKRLKKKKKKESITQSNLIKKWKQSRGLHLICPLKCGGLFKRRAGTRTDKGPFYRSLTPSHLIEFFPRYRNESEQIHTHELDAEGVASDQFCWSPPRDSELSWNMPAWQSVCTAPFNSASNYCTKGFK